MYLKRQYGMGWRRDEEKGNEVCYCGNSIEEIEAFLTNATL